MCTVAGEERVPAVNTWGAHGHPAQWPRDMPFHKEVEKPNALRRGGSERPGRQRGRKVSPRVSRAERFSHGSCCFTGTESPLPVTVLAPSSHSERLYRGRRPGGAETTPVPSWGDVVLMRCCVSLSSLTVRIFSWFRGEVSPWRFLPPGEHPVSDGVFLCKTPRLSDPPSPGWCIDLSSLWP